MSLKTKSLSNYLIFPLPLQHETQAAVAFPASLADHHWDTRGLACPPLILPVYPELPVSGGLHEQYPGSCLPCWDPELWPRPTPEVPQAAAVLKGSDEALCVSLTSSWLSPHTKDFQTLQSGSKQHRGFFSQDDQRKRLQGQRPRGLAVWTDTDLKRDAVVGRPESTLVEYLNIKHGWKNLFCWSRLKQSVWWDLLWRVNKDKMFTWLWRKVKIYLFLCTEDWGLHVYTDVL